MESFLGDLKHALRMMRQSPSFALTAIAALALGIGANTAMFTVVDTVILRPLPFADSDRIVNLGRRGGLTATIPMAAGVPALRATRVDPLTALRQG